MARFAAATIKDWDSAPGGHDKTDPRHRRALKKPPRLWDADSRPADRRHKKRPWALQHPRPVSSAYFKHCVQQIVHAKCQIGQNRKELDHVGSLCARYPPRNPYGQKKSPARIKRTRPSRTYGCSRKADRSSSYRIATVKSDPHGSRNTWQCFSIAIRFLPGYKTVSERRRTVTNRNEPPRSRTVTGDPATCHANFLWICYPFLNKYNSPGAAAGAFAQAVRNTAQDTDRRSQGNGARAPRKLDKKD